MMCPATSPTSRRNKRLERALATARYRPPTVLVVKCFGAGEIVAGAAFGGHCAQPIGHSPPRRSPHPNSLLVGSRARTQRGSRQLGWCTSSSSVEQRRVGDCCLRQAAEGNVLVELHFVKPHGHVTCTTAFYSVQVNHPA